MKKLRFLGFTLLILLLIRCSEVVVTLERLTLDSVTKVDGHPFYVMHYYGPYITENADHDIPEDAHAPENVPSQSPAWACSLFAALGNAEALLYGRNFDWKYSPAVLLFTDPPDGYASVSMVDIAYLDFSDTALLKLDKLPVEQRRPLLQAPFLPFDGMNEHGLVVGMAAVPNSAMLQDASKPIIGSLGIIREMLDHAKTVDDAVALMADYNIDITDGPALHYLIADASGDAVLVEFYEGEMHVIPKEDAWHQATNFLRTATDATAGVCQRYSTIQMYLAEAQGQLVTQEAMDLLESVSQSNTQWSVVYGISAGRIDVVMQRNYKRVHTFLLSE